MDKSVEFIWIHMEKKYDESNPFETAQGNLMFEDDQLVIEKKKATKIVGKRTFNKYVAQVKQECNNKPTT
jgi:hypothetical protein